MSKQIKRVVSFVLMLTIVIGMIPPIHVSAAADTTAMGELVDSYSANSSSFTLSESSRIFVIADSEPTGDLLQTVQLIQRQFAADGRPSTTPMTIAWGPESWITTGDIVVDLDASSGVAAEGYTLDVTSYAKITVSDVDGLIYGANMLHKHLRYAGSNSVQGFTASDAPDTVQRAVSLDCGRKYYTKDWICNFIRQMSWMGYNTLQFHFSDDSGFRFDLWDEAYYTGQFQPKNDFSWICGSNYTSWTLSAYKNDADKGKYLTTAEVVEILQTAAEYHIDVIPCFDSPSHLDYLTWTFEQHYDSDNSYSFYSTYDSKTYYADDVNGIINYTNSRDWSTALQWPYYSAVNVKSDLAKAFIFELYIDIANFFKEYAGSTDMSVGADEVQLSTANISSSYSYAWGFPEFVDYINELNTLLNSKGYTMRMYNDFMGSTSYNASGYSFADNIEIQYWDSPFNPNGSTASNHTEPVSYYVNEGRILYNCIQTNTYYALRKTSSGSDARSVDNRQWTFYHANEEDIYNEWYSADISEHGDYSEDVADVPADNLGGAYFLIWCDYACVSTEKEIWNGCYDTSGSGEYYSLLDRMWSNTIKMWNWDINDSLSFSSYADLRDTFGVLPGLGSGTDACSQKPEFPSSTDPVSGYSGGCTAYNAYCQIKITAETDVMTMPCTTAVESSSAWMETANAGDVYTAVGLYMNTENELWYKVNTKTGAIGNIRATDTEYVGALTDDITITGATAPSAHVKGNIFLVQGDISAQRNTLTSVAVYVYSGFGVSGGIVTGDSAAVTDNAYSLLNSTIDYNTAFNSVPLGEHTYAISADYQSHYANGDTVVTLNDTVYLVEEYFVVVSASTDQSSCSHSYSDTVISEATCTEGGVTVYACGTCGHVYEEITETSGHDYEESFFGASCLDYEKVCYTCGICGYSYWEYPDEIKSDWTGTKPEGIDVSLIETKTQYRYSDYETVTSYETSLEGYTQIGSTWKQSATGSVDYVNDWPSGFNTSDSLYTKYNNKSNKVTAVTGDTTRTVIDSDKVTGYLYYHWCHSGYPYTVASETSYYSIFHAYYSTTAPSNYTCDTSDWSYKTYGECCSNSDWFFVANVYTQSYTNYQKLFTYERWTDWSSWSDTPATASSTRQVETRTVYRYVNAELGDHAWDNGVCSVCGKVCDHTYQNNVCTECGLAKPMLDYYLVGHINGADYGCEADYENLGEYKFVDGKLVATFSADSYVFLKGSDNAHWYMTQSYVTSSSATLYNTKTGASEKMFVPGGHEITFTLVDNGDDTLTLSYVSVACGHEKHSTEGVCNICGAAVEHSYDTTGFCSCGLECEHNMENGYCTRCGAECDHVYKDFVCTLCGAAKPELDYYLVGYINGADYGCEADYENLGEYKFVDGKLVVTFSEDSYVFVKASDNAHWYMTDGWQDFVSGGTLYNTEVLGENANKIYVPGCTEVTFTLVDNGDDTLFISYEAVECPHRSHDTNGKCLACGSVVSHTYSAETGFCSCGLECEHSFTDSVCTKCGMACGHSYQNNVCTACGAVKPVLDYYLFGYINGADYACEGDADNLGKYKFTDGSLVAYFTSDSYVAVKGSDNASWYMFQTYVTETSGTLYKTTTGAAQKMLVPGGMKITFTLVDNGDDTYVLSYVAVECPHDRHSTEGVCDLCTGNVSHSYKDGYCSCGLACSHVYLDGVCSICGLECAHQWSDGQCSVCGMLCDHSWSDGVCETCKLPCDHGWDSGVCGTCGMNCDHVWENGFCKVCNFACDHTYQDNVCTVCKMVKPFVEYYLFGQINGADYGCGEDATNLGEYKFINGTLVVIFRQDSYVAVKTSTNGGWYMTDGDQNEATGVVLYNSEDITTDGYLFVPGAMQITFTLVDNGDDTLTLSYTTAECPHQSHDTSGVCAACGNMVSHSYEGVISDPTCTEAGFTTYTCSVCGHSYTGDEVSALGHNYESAVTDPTCTEAGFTTYTCMVCGDSYTGAPVDAAGHDWNTDGVCGVCGEICGHSFAGGVCGVCGMKEPEKEPFDIAFASMTMGNSLAINFAFEQDHVDDWTGYYVRIVKTYADGRDDVVEIVDYADWKQAEINGTAHYYATFNGIAAKEMTDDVYVTVHNGSGEAVSNTWSDSVRAQAMRNLTKSDISDLEKTMVVDMLNYGAAAQNYFSYDTEDLANSLLSEEQKACATESTSYEDTRYGIGSYYVASNLLFKSNLQLLFAFQNVSTDMHAVVTYTNHRGEEISITIDGSDFEPNGSYYVVNADTLVIADGRQDVTCRIYDGSRLVVKAVDSVESYVARMGGKDELFDLLMKFSDSAYAYFHPNT